MSGDDPNLSELSMMELFRSEVETQASLFNTELLALERNPADAARIEALMRAAHSIKGAARIVGLEPAVTIAHAMEDALVAAQNAQIALDSGAFDLLLRGIDFLTRIGKVNDAEQPAWQQSHAGEIQQLETQLAVLRDPSLVHLVPPSPASSDESSKITRAPVPVGASGETSLITRLADASMVDLFRQELESQAASLNQGLLGLEDSPDTADALQSLMRAAHSIKGAARIIGLDPAVKLAHLMEDAFVAAQEGKITLTSESVDILLKGVDFFDKLRQVSAHDIGAWLTAQESVLSSLSSQIESVRAGRAPSVPASPAALLTESPPPSTTAPRAPGAEQPTTLRDRAVKVTVENLNRLMSLTAEVLVESGRSEPLTAQLTRLKKSHQKLSSVLAGIRETVSQSPAGIGVRDLCSEAQNRLEQCRRDLASHVEQMEEFSGRLTNLSDRLYREVISSRMRPFASGTQGFPRLVRDLSRTLAKRVRFEIVGKSTPVDRDILEKLEAPLSHILRNAMDHGMETPEVRAQSGKALEGSLRLEARHRAGMLLIEVSDDGPGIDLDRLRRKVIERDLSTPDLVAKMTEGELLEFLFLPGFSTAEKISEISGRGVGLDVVQTMVHEAGGSVHIVSELGKGATFQLQLPITRSVMRALLVKIAGDPYAFPLARIDRALKVPFEELKTIENRLYFSLEGQDVALVFAEDVLDLKTPRRARQETAIVVVSDHANRYGIAVDGFIGEYDLVVRPLDPRLGKVPDISSASLMEDGTPLLIIDVEDIVRSINSMLAAGGLKHTDRFHRPQGVKVKKRVLVVDDSVTVREVERKFLENNGYEVDVAVDGREGWNAVRLCQYDLVISDVDMPRMNGLEFVGLIKSDERLKTLPVIIVSYKDREEDHRRGLEAGANYYFAKSSFHDATVINAVRELIGDSHA